jgi:hypothetical protein
LAEKELNSMTFPSFDVRAMLASPSFEECAEGLDVWCKELEEQDAADMLSACQGRARRFLG